MSVVFKTGLPHSNALTLQCCGQCQHINYPPRELCGHCLADNLQWQAVDASGVLQARTELHYSLEPTYAQHLPWAVGSIKLDCGPVVLAHLQPDIEVGAAVRLSVIQDPAGNAMLAATRCEEDGANASTWLQRINFREISA